MSKKRSASFVNVQAMAAPTKNSPSNKYWRMGGLLSKPQKIKHITCKNNKWIVYDKKTPTW